MELSYEMLSDELKPGVSQKIRFEKRKISTMMGISRYFGVWGLRRKTQSHQFFKGVLFYKYYDSD